MKIKFLIILMTVFAISGVFNATVFAGTDFSKYHSPGEINKLLTGYVRNNKDISRLHKIAISPGGVRVLLIEIGNQLNLKRKTEPGIFVSGNLNGVNVISSEASLFLIDQLLSDKSKRGEFTWYILPVGNPDAALRFFKKPLYSDSGNGRAVNNDMDDKIDEDGVEDLNGDGIISMMRVKDPEGEYIVVPGNKRLMKKADWTKNEKGMYKLFSEGIDNDGDGKYNEDGPGGVDISLNFPHLFKHFNRKSGDWPGSETEVFGIFQFIFSHKDIAMTMNFGETNFCLIPPKGGRKSKVDYSKIKIPERMGKFLGSDPDRTYSMSEIMEMVQKVVPSGFNVTESMVASFLGLGPVVNPLKGDLKFYEEVSKEYKKYLKEQKLDLKRIDPPKAKDGSFELWSYYHLGLPSFSMDFWTLPKIEKKKEGKSDITAEKLEKMSKEEFLSLGKDNIEKFLISVNAPKNIKAEFLINGVKNGIMTPKKMAGFMKKMKKSEDSSKGDPKEIAFLEFNDKELNGKGFVEWKKYVHPTLGEVEIGGIKPFSSNIPPVEIMADLIKKQVPFIFNITKKLARIKIKDLKVSSKGAGVYSVKVWIGNSGFFPYPTEMGKKNRRIGNIIVILEGKGMTVLEGKKRAKIAGIGSFGTKPIEWLIYAPKPVNLKVKTETRIATNDEKSFYLGGKK